MSLLLRQAEDILETATMGSGEVAIAIGHRGNVRMLDPAGWTLPALRIEYGAATVFKVERRGGRIVVEGWDGDRHCRLEKSLSKTAVALLPGMPQASALFALAG